MLKINKLAKLAYFLFILLTVGLTAFTGRELVTMAQSGKPQQNNNTCTLINGTGGNTKIIAFGPNLGPAIKSALTNNTNNPTKISVSLNCISTSITTVVNKASVTPQSAKKDKDDNDKNDDGDDD